MTEISGTAPSSSFSASLAAAPPAKTVMTNAVDDKAALNSLNAVETGLASATSFQDAGWHAAVAQSAANLRLATDIAGEQQQIATSRASVTSMDPGVTEAVMTSTREANERLWGRRQDALNTLTSETTGAEAAATYNHIALMREYTQPAAVARSTPSNAEYLFSGGTSLDEFVLLPQKPGPSLPAALNAELAALISTDLASNVAAMAYSDIPLAPSGAASTLYDAKFAQAEIAPALPDTRYNAPSTANTTALAYRPAIEPEVVYDSGKFKEMPRSVSFLNALGISKTDTLGMMKSGLADARFVDVTDLLAANAATTVRQTGSAQILAFTPPQLTFDPLPDAGQEFAEQRRKPAPQMQPRGPVSYGSR